MAESPIIVTNLSWDEVTGTAASGAYRTEQNWARIVPLPRATVQRQLSEMRSDPVSSTVHFVYVDGTECQTENGLFSEFSEQLRFPGYFGWNWDAFNECMSDLLDIRDGGIGSAFGDRSGIDANCLIITIFEAGALSSQAVPVSSTRFARACDFAVSGGGLGDEQSGLATLRVLFQLDKHKSDSVDRRFNW